MKNKIIGSLLLCFSYTLAASFDGYEETKSVGDSTSLLRRKKIIISLPELLPADKHLIDESGEFSCSWRSSDEVTKKELLFELYDCTMPYVGKSETLAAFIEELKREKFVAAFEGLLQQHVDASYRGKRSWLEQSGLMCLKTSFQNLSIPNQMYARQAFLDHIGAIIQEKRLVPPFIHSERSIQLLPNPDHLWYANYIKYLLSIYTALHSA